MSHQFEAIDRDQLASATGAVDYRQVGAAAWQGAQDGFWGANKYPPLGTIVSPAVAGINGIYQGGRNAGQQLGWWE